MKVISSPYLVYVARRACGGFRGSSGAGPAAPATTRPRSSWRSGKPALTASLISRTRPGVCIAPSSNPALTLAADLDLVDADDRIEGEEPIPFETRHSVVHRRQPCAILRQHRRPAQNHRLLEERASGHSSVHGGESRPSRPVMVSTLASTCRQGSEPYPLLRGGAGGSPGAARAASIPCRPDDRPRYRCNRVE